MAAISRALANITDFAIKKLFTQEGNSVCKKQATTWVRAKLTNIILLTKLEKTLEVFQDRFDISRSFGKGRLNN